MKKLLLLFALISFSTSAQIAEKVKSMKAHTGYFNFYYDESNDKIFLEVKKLNEEFLYTYSLAQGVGNNDLGLDRGQLGNEQVVFFEKQGNKIFLVQPNTGRIRAMLWRNYPCNRLSLSPCYMVLKSKALRMEPI